MLRSVHDRKRLMCLTATLLLGSIILILSGNVSVVKAAEEQDSQLNQQVNYLTGNVSEIYVVEWQGSQLNQQVNYLIRNEDTLLCLDSGYQSFGLPYQAPCNPDNPAQKWALFGNNAGGSTIRNVGSGTCLDHADNGSLGFQVYVFDCHFNGGQAFNINVKAALELVFFVDIRARSTGLALDGWNGANPYLWTYGPNVKNQEWLMTAVDW